VLTGRRSRRRGQKKKEEGRREVDLICGAHIAGPVRDIA